MPESTRKPWRKVFVFGCLCVTLLLVLSCCRTRPNQDSWLFTIDSYIENIKAWTRLRNPWRPQKSDNGVTQGHVWGLLVAGSSGYGNYRHQADVAHSYHVLRRGGVLHEHIIVMMYDDIAESPSNPHPGTIRNHPRGPDLYQGLPKDYTRDQVNTHNFLAVLRGEENKISKGPRASGRVIEATTNDRVFLFYSDHGAPGLLGMPRGEYLYADQLHEAIRFRHANKGFKEMVLYIEACESGSMFEGLLESDMNVYATTASNGFESSWGVYCPGMDPSPPPEYMTCLGDLYSVSWMEDADSNDLSIESLYEQYQRVKERTSNNYTFVQGSHVTEFGDLEIEYEPASWYLGEVYADADGNGRRHTLSENEFKNVPNLSGNAFMNKHGIHQEYDGGESSMRYSQREADLLPLILRSERDNDVVARVELEQERHRRSTIDLNIEQMVHHLLIYNKALFEGSGWGIEHLLKHPTPTPSKTSALVDDWNCLRDMITVWESTCGELGQYGMKHSRIFANLCNLGIDSQQLATAAQHTC